MLFFIQRILTQVFCLFLWVFLFFVFISGLSYEIKSLWDELWDEITLLKLMWQHWLLRTTFQFPLLTFEMLHKPWFCLFELINEVRYKSMENQNMSCGKEQFVISYMYIIIFQIIVSKLYFTLTIYLWNEAILMVKKWKLKTYKSIWISFSHNNWEVEVLKLTDYTFSVNT